MPDELVTVARECRRSAYAPYSGYKIGAALRTEEGSIYKGCNIETVNLSNSLHAEEVALSDAVKNGEHEFNSLAVSSKNGDPPCGMCRQTLWEFCEPSLVVLVDSVESGEVTEFTLAELYPNAFFQNDFSSEGSG